MRTKESGEVEDGLTSVRLRKQPSQYNGIIAKVKYNAEIGSRLSVTTCRFDETDFTVPDYQ